MLPWFSQGVAGRSHVTSPSQRVPQNHQTPRAMYQLLITITNITTLTETLHSTAGLTKHSFDYTEMNTQARCLLPYIHNMLQVANEI